MISPLLIELAQVEMIDSDGLLGAMRFPLSRLAIPPLLRLEGDGLRWSWYDPDRPGNQPVEADPKGALHHFVGLRDRNDVLRFARRYGVLGLCKHNLPATHAPPPEREPLSGSPLGCQPMGFPEPCEPIERWLHYVRQAQSLLLIGAALHGEPPRRPRLQDWRTVYADVFGTSEYPREVPEDVRSIRMSRHLLTTWVNEWLRLGDVRPSFTWASAEVAPRFELAPGASWGASGTFGILAVQLMITLSRGSGLAVCDGCGVPYVRLGRRPQAKRLNYCPGCREKGIPARDRQRRHREKGKGGLR